MYATINGLLNKSTKALPVLDLKSEKELAYDFLSFFIWTVEKIRANVESNLIGVVIRLHDFDPLTPGDVEKIIVNFPSKTCSLDTIPTWLAKDNLHTLLNIITKVVNSSLSCGTFLGTLKQSIITPILKKSNLDHNILKHYRPVANIKFMSKITEKAASCQVTSQIYSIIDSNDLGEITSLRTNGFIAQKTTLLKAKSDFLQYADNKKTVLLMLLDMSAAFDMVDHPIRIEIGLEYVTLFSPSSNPTLKTAP